MPSEANLLCFGGAKHSGRRYDMKHFLTSALGVVGGAIAAAFGGCGGLGLEQRRDGRHLLH